MKLITYFFIVFCHLQNVFANGGIDISGGGGPCKFEFDRYFSTVLSDVETYGVELPGGLTANDLRDKFGEITVVPLKKNIELCESTKEENVTACGRKADDDHFSQIELYCGEEGTTDSTAWPNLSERHKRQLPLHEISLWFPDQFKDQKGTVSNRIIDDIDQRVRYGRKAERAEVFWRNVTCSGLKELLEKNDRVKIDTGPWHVSSYYRYINAVSDRVDCGWREKRDKKLMTSDTKRCMVKQCKRRGSFAVDAKRLNCTEIKEALGYANWMVNIENAGRVSETDRREVVYDQSISVDTSGRYLLSYPSRKHHRCKKKAFYTPFDVKACVVYSCRDYEDNDDDGGFPLNDPYR